LAFWNGRDPFLKERIFGLTGPEGNHGEDAKEYWWYIDGILAALASAAAQMPYPKDDINDHVIHGAWGLPVIG
jgi:hypothetical protein